MSAASPLDVVLGGQGERPARRRLLRLAAWVSAIVVHAVIVVAAMRSGPSLEAWSAELALEVHEALVDDQVIELATPPAPTPEPPPSARAPRALSAAPTHHTAPTSTPEPAAAAPAQAAEVVTQDAPVDLTGTTVVTGNAASSIGGATATGGTATEPTAVGTLTPAPNAVPVSPPAPAPQLTRAVQLDPAQWRCEWPSEAVSEEIYDQAVVLRVVVLADGRVEAAQLIDDPGHGFGPAALACAKRTRFSPALDASGAPTRAVSPPIRVRFTR